MKKDIVWLKEEIKVFQEGENMFTAEFNAGVQQALEYVQELIDQLDEPDERTQLEEAYKDILERHIFYYNEAKYQVIKESIIPQFVADYIEKWECEGLTIYECFSFGNNDVDEDVNKWLYNNTMGENLKRQHLLIDAIRYGYEVEKEILWEIPIPDLKTSYGRNQYLTYDPKAKTYFASRKNGRLKQTFNAKDLASVPTPHRHYAVLCDLKKIEEVTE